MLLAGRPAGAQTTAEPDVQFALSLAASNAPAHTALDVPMELPGQLDIHIRPPAGGWVRCAEMEFDVAWPADGPTNAQVLLYIVDWEWNWYQTLAPGYLTPGRARRFRVNLMPGAEAMEPVGHHVPWHLRSLCAPIAAAIRVFGAGPFAGTCRVERVVGRSRPDPAEPPAIRNVRASAPRLQCYEKFELTFTLPDRYPNPFDPDQVSVTARFEGPTGTVASVNGFYSQDYYRTLGPTGERVESQGKPQWKVRFTPRTPGRYRYSLTAKDRAGTSHWGPAEFEATPSRNPGFVRVSRSDPRFFEFDDGSYFFPIGHNIRSPFDVRTDQQFPWKQRWPEGSSAYMRYFRDMSRNGENFVEIWSAAWSLGLEWSPISPGYHGVGQYNLRNAWEMDQVLDAADRFGLYLNVVVHNHGKFSTYVDEEWDDNPFNTARGGYLDLPEEYFSNPRALRDFQNLMRYMVARWGHSTRVFAWELWSELNLTGSRRVDHKAHYQPEVEEWHRTMGRWLRSVDPFRHLITTHYSGDFRTQNPAITALPEIDHASVDAYHSDQRALRIVGLIHETAAYNNAFGKPVVITEFGGQSMAQQGFDHIDAAHHSALWSSTCLTTGGTPLFWWWMLIEEESLYGRYAAIARFMRGEDRRGPEKRSWASWEPDDDSERTRATISGGRGRIAAICYGNDTDVIGWFYDQDRFQQAGDATVAPSTGLTIIVAGLQGGPYRIEFWDTKDGKVIESADVESSRGILRRDVPPFRRDMAFKVKPQFRAQRKAGRP
jgi:hypothetical protein